MPGATFSPVERDAGSGTSASSTVSIMLTQSITAFAAQTNRTFNDFSTGFNLPPSSQSATATDFIGNSFGAEYQGTLRMARSLGNDIQGGDGNDLAPRDVPGRSVFIVGGTDDSDRTFGRKPGQPLDQHLCAGGSGDIDKIGRAHV